MQHDAQYRWLDDRGLLLCAFQLHTLPANLATTIRAARPEDSVSRSNSNLRLLLMANAGPKFWQLVKASTLHQSNNPVDAVSIATAEAFSREFLGIQAINPLYPTPPNQSHIPLMRLGNLAGWNVPSPLGLGLHPKYGPWSAYRAAWLTESTLLPDTFNVKPNSFNTTGTDAWQQSASLCIGCDAPCATACPADAVNLGQSFNSQSCYAYRQPGSSVCHTNCLARRACPIGSAYRYEDGQLEYHMSTTWPTQTAPIR